MRFLPVTLIAIYKNTAEKRILLLIIISVPEPLLFYNTVNANSTIYRYLWLNEEIIQICPQAQLEIEKESRRDL